ncbi:MAG: sulfotransferase [bacterium]|nr:sulfotransferase [bacterium]
MSRRPDIRITDLAEPVLDEAQKQVLAAVSGLQVEFDEESILGEAMQRTGLSNFGPDDFRERLRIWCQSLEEDENLSVVGQLGARSDTVRYALNRLRVEDLIARHPEILDVEIRRPIIIIGLPRSGTTHLLNLISADTRLRSLPYWESVEPIQIQGEEPGPDGRDPRHVRNRARFERTDGLLPHVRAMHYMTPEHIHEEIELQAIDFSSYVLEWIAHVPRLRDAYLASDQTASYGYMKKVLQAIQWQRGPDRWVLKSPQHLEQLVPLYKTFPDATFAITARDPVSVIASTITMEAYSARLLRKRVDLDAISTYWCNRIETLLSRCVRDRHVLPPEQSIDVPFKEFMADDIGMVERIYELAGHPMTNAAREMLARYMAENPRGKYGRVRYDLRGDFGIDPDELRKRFGFYFERFPVEAEMH